MATLHLMVGLPCSGKTTAAQRLEDELYALRLTPDVWQLRLFGHDVGEPEHDERHSAVEAIMWEVAARVLALGVDVILDFGFWAREERDSFRQKAQALGAGFRIHYMDASREELFRRLEIRNAQDRDDIFRIPKEDMETYLRLFQPPDPEELA